MAVLLCATEPRVVAVLRTRVDHLGAAVKKIGLLGGMSWESSIEYYRLVNEEVRERLGGLYSAECSEEERGIRLAAPLFSAENAR